MSKHTHNDILAAEYVLGTLRGAARRRFEILMDGDPALISQVCRWQEALGVLDDTDTPVQPPARVWRTIQLRLPQPPDAKQGLSGQDPSGSSRQPRLANAMKTRMLRHGWQLVSFALAASLVGVMVWPRLQAPNAPGMESRPVAVLANTQGQGAQQIVASFDAQSGTLVLTPLNLTPTVAGHSLELWLIGKDKKPVPLGLLKAHNITVVTLEKNHLSPETTRAVSLEPAGGSPTGQPTGTVLYAGKVHAI